MTLEAISSSELSNLLIYDTISAASPSPHYFHQTIPCNNSDGTGAGFNGKCAPSLLATNASARSEPPSSSSSGIKKRRRKPRNCRNKEEAESQRMTHIAVERNRRRQMNEHLAVLRSLMPESYVQRGDQASIVGGAIDFVKELEQLLQSLEAQKRVLQHRHQHHQQQPDNCVNGSLKDVSGTVASDAVPPPFAQFFTYPQYMWCHAPREYMPEDHRVAAALADIEVTLVETHTNLRILSPRRPGQLLKMVAGLQALELTILHINVTTLDPMVLYSISAKLEEGCNLTSVDDIAAAVHHMLSLIEDEAIALS